MTTLAPRLTPQEEIAGTAEWLTDLLEVLREAKTDAEKLDVAIANVEGAVKMCEREKI